ncbi:hypothetical protein K8W59_06620 [Nocardioides rotundus]|uniref:hypothetical protein n=1 Tax=Nocardioides rotundus TaxID=1774216 RepID=UPI001CBBE1A8|nr:hypothetical protein [Nocardioides rotundus]UAL31139.1 hypothetical protein K8W59_06620 [Nocardioides rotundus]
MPRKILVTGPSGAIHLVETPADNEFELQKCLQDNPQLLPGEDMGLSGELLVVGRETRVASGAIDLLCLSRSGELVIIEFKTGPQNTDFRHALAQVIDYGSDIWKLGDWTTFDEGIVHPYLKTQHDAGKLIDCDDLESAASSAWGLTQDEWDSLTVRLDQVINRGDFHFVVAAQRFIDSMKVTASYLNATAQSGRFYLVEVIRLDGAGEFDGAGQTAYAAQVVHRPDGRAGYSSSPAGKASKDAFLAAISLPAYREAMSELFARAVSLGLSMEWGAKGASIRLKSPDRSEPISVGWVFLEGGQYKFAKHVTFGVESTSLANHPTIEPAIRDFCQQVKQVPGAVVAGGKSYAAIFEPAEFVQAKDKLITLLDELAKATTEGG